MNRIKWAAFGLPTVVLAVGLGTIASAANPGWSTIRYHNGAFYQSSAEIRSWDGTADQALSIAYQGLPSCNPCAVRLYSSTYTRISPSDGWVPNQSGWQTPNLGVVASANNSAGFWSWYDSYGYADAQYPLGSYSTVAAEAYAIW